MPLRNTGWLQAYQNDVRQRLSLAHGDCSRYVAALRDSNVDIWTQAPSDPARLTAGRTAYSLDGWAGTYRMEAQRVADFVAAHGAQLNARYPTDAAEISDYQGAMAAIRSAMASCLAQYTDGSGALKVVRVSQAHRDQLANAIAAELE